MKKRTKQRARVGALPFDPQRAMYAIVGGVLAKAINAPLNSIKGSDGQSAFKGYGKIVSSAKVLVGAYGMSQKDPMLRDLSIGMVAAGGLELAEQVLRKADGSSPFAAIAGGVGNPYYMPGVAGTTNRQLPVIQLSDDMAYSEPVNNL